MTSREHTDETKATIKEFKNAVNMTASELEKWLKTDESKDVGYKEDGKGEAVGHVSGRNIVEILGKKQADYSDADLEQMQRTVSYVHRHLAQRPDGDVGETRWRYSLMNWGHDPLK
jgi:hypothetical protein